ncbi:MAG: glycosyltransferase [Acidimicrobiales bacterium]
MPLRRSCTTVLAIPAGHPYVQRVRPDGVRILPDPTDPWWPHPGLEPDYVATVRNQVDLVHLHFGYEHRSAAQLAQWLDALDALGLPLVVTVHDLRNPHLADNVPHERHLDLLLRRADVVTTLTGAAARQIERRSQRRVVIVAHPPLLDHAGCRPATESGLVGVTLKDRPSVARPDEVLPPVLAAVVASGGHLEVRLEPTASGALAARAKALLSGAPATVTVAAPSDDAAFAAGLARLHVAVLAYRFGTHSGWLEACRDVGTRVVAPSSGCYRDQWDQVVTYDVGVDGVDSPSLRRAVEHSLALDPVPAPDPAEQEGRRDDIVAAHSRIYRDLMTDGRP